MKGALKIAAGVGIGLVMSLPMLPTVIDVAASMLGGRFPWEGYVALGLVFAVVGLIWWSPWTPGWERFVRSPGDFSAKGDKDDPPRKVG